MWWFGNNQEKGASSVEDDPPLLKFRVTVTRPDGHVHSEVEIERTEKPYIWASRGGVTYIDHDNIHAPVGWKLDVKECRK